MTETRRCPVCDAEIPADAPAGQCPKCLLQAGFESAALAGPELGPTVRSPAPSAFQPPPADQLTKLFPQLEILELLGQGGMGAVYKARQKGLDRLVAVKILPPEVGQDPAFAERFTREARAMAKLSHPHIVAIHDFGQSEGQFYFVMEYIDGANLRQVIQAKQLTPAEALAIVPQICDALQYAHDEGIVHRDIKPENILVDKKGRVKIADFGLSKLLHHDDQPEVSLTGTHQVMGTLRYMAPEQMQGTKTVDHRADIYSLGVVFYELLTGAVPMGRFDPPSQKVEIDIRLDEVVLRALAQEPSKRYQQASEVKSDVESISTSQVIAATPSAMRSTTVSDALVFRRLTPILIAIWLGWAALLVALQWGYLQKAKWYFDEELPYKYLTTGVTYSSWMLMGFLTYWWYLLAKTSGSPRSLSDFWKTSQTPDQRVVRLWPIAIYFAVAVIAMVVASVFGSDAVQATTMLVVWIAAPPAVMVSCVWAYGLPAISQLNGQVRQPMAVGNTLESHRDHAYRAPGGTSLAQVRFVVGDPSEVARLANFHFSSLGYQLIDERPEACIFQRGKYWGGLWETDIRGLHTILTVRTAPAADGKAWVSCDWSIRRLGSWITRGDVAVLEAEGRGFAALLNATVETDGSASPARVLSAEPRFSRFAIAGAVWALFGVLTVLPILYFVGLNRVWDGTAAPTDIIHTQPPFAFSLFMGALLVIGSGAPIGTTIFGVVAIGHIKRSGSKIVGVPLAVGDAIFFPLLALFAGVAFLIAQSIVAFTHLEMSDATAPATLVAAVVCVFIGRVAWQKINPVTSVAAKTFPPSAESDQDYARRKITGPAVGLMVAAIFNLLGGMAWIAVFFSDAHTIAAQVSVIVLTAFLVINGFLQLGAAAELLQLRRSPLGDFSTTCAIIVPPGLVIAIPAVILYWVRSVDPRVKAAFQSTGESDQNAGPSSAAPKTVEDTAEAICRSVRGPAIAMIVSAAITLLVLVALLVFIIVLIRDGRANWWELPLVAAGGLPVFMILRGGLRMLSVESYKQAWGGATVCALDILVWPIALPVGLWALAVLSRPDVKAAFSQNATNPMALNPSNGPSSLPAPRDKSSWVCAIVGLILLMVGLVLPGILIATVKSVSEQVAALSCIAFTAPALVFGWCGRGHRLGTGTAIASAIVLGSALLLSAVGLSPQTSNGADGSESTESLVSTSPAATTKSDVRDNGQESLTVDDQSLIDNYLRKIGLIADRQAEVKQILSGYRAQYVALERRHTKIVRDDQGHLHVLVMPFSAECQTLANQLAAELGGLVEQRYLPKVSPGTLPGELFGIAGEAKVDVELWKDGDAYHWSEQLSDWTPAPGMTRSNSSRSGSSGSLDGVPPEYRRFWSEPTTSQATP